MNGVDGYQITLLIEKKGLKFVHLLVHRAVLIQCNTKINH